MKVYIGPYRDNITVAHWYRRWIKWRHKKSYWDVEEAEYTKLDWFVETMCDMIDKVILAPINRFRRKERKVDIRIDPYDTWSADHTLALIILPVLRQLKETNHGYGGTDREDAPDDPEYGDDRAEHEPRGFSQKRWDYVMDEMIFAFEKIAEDIDWDLDIWKKYDEQWTDEAYEERNAIQKRINNGLRLFGKYYQSLWD